MVERPDQISNLIVDIRNPEPRSKKEKARQFNTTHFKTSPRNKQPRIQ